MRDKFIALSAAIVRTRVALRGTGKYVAARRAYDRAWREIAEASGLSQPQAAMRFNQTVMDWNANPDVAERCIPGNALPAPLIDRLVTALEPSK